eukprot:g8958.t1
MMSKVVIYIVFLVAFVVAFAAMYWISIGTDLSGANGFINILVSQFAQSLGGQDYDAVDDMVTSEFKFLFILFLVLFSVFTVITVINLVIAVVTTAYEEGVEESASYWAYVQLSNIHEDDFIEPNRSIIRRIIKNACNCISKSRCSRGDVKNENDAVFKAREKEQQKRDEEILNSTTKDQNEDATKQNTDRETSKKTEKKYTCTAQKVSSGNVGVEEHKEM